jgi:hypothetical protein
VFRDVQFSSLIEYPTMEDIDPTWFGASPSSCETRWASEMAEIRL